MKIKLKYAGIIVVVGFLGILMINMHSLDSIAEAAQKAIRVVRTTNAEGLNPYRHYDYGAWDSVKELSAESDAMFKGMVISVHSPEVMVTGYITSGGSNETLRDVYTVSEICVEKVMKGDLKPGDVVQIRQLGGLYNGTEYPTDHPEILTKNMGGIFFVKLNGNMPAELINPSQGWVKIVDGKVNNRLENQSYKKHYIVADDLTLDENNFKNGMSEDEVIELINKSI